MRDDRNGCFMRWSLIAALLISASPAAAQDDAPPPLNFAPSPLTPEQQAEVVEYRTYLSTLIGSQIDMAEVDSLVKQAGDMLQVRSVKFKIKIARSGQLLSRGIDASCGYEPLDAVFLAALDRSKPFSPPPAFSVSPPEEIDATFTIVSAASAPPQ